MISVISRWARRFAVPIGLVAVFLLSTATPVSAHAALISTTPGDGDVLATSPAEITLTFNEPIQLTDAITVLTGDGDPVEAQVKGLNETVTITPDEPLADGTYIVGWRVVSADSHPVAGGFSFSVGAPSETSIEIPAEETPRDVDALRKAGEGLRYGGVLIAAGLVPFALLIARPVTLASAVTRRRLERTGLVAGIAAVIAALALSPLTVLWQSAAPLGSFGSALTEVSTWRSETAVASWVLLVALAVAWFARGRAPAVACAAAAAAVGSLVIVGHTRTFGPVALVLTADLIHVIVAALWAGGLIGLVVMFSAGRDVRALHAQTAVRRFSAVALGSVAVAGVTGGILWWRIPHTVRDLPDSSYGVHLLVKVVAIATVVAIAAWNLRHVRTHRTVDLAALRRTVIGEVAVLGVVIAATAGLVTQVPRGAEVIASDDTEAEPEAAQLEFDLDQGRTGTLTLTPGTVGTNSAHLELIGPDDAPIDPLEPPQLSIGVEDLGLGPFQHDLVAVAPGQYEGIIDLPLEGLWQIEVAVRVSTYERPSDELELEVTP